MNIHRRSLVVAFLASSAISSPALADNPIYRNWDENGVDLVVGDYRFNFVEGSIGNGNTELSLVRVNNADAFSQWDQILLTQTEDSPGSYTARVTLPDGSDDTFLNGSSLEGNGSFITQWGAGIQYYTTADGTEITFGVSGMPACVMSAPCKFLPSKITYPSGRTVDFVWTVAPGGTAWRLESLTNNDGYSIVFNYQSNTVGNAGWSKRASSVFKNGATAVRTISYAYPVAGTTDVTDATNNTWRVTNTSIRRPNEASPGLSYALTSGIVNSVTANGVTTSYGRSVAGNIVTLTRTTAGDSNTIISDLSIDRIKSMTNGVGKTTSITNDTLGRITKITAPEGNSVEYTLDSRGNPSTTQFKPKTGSPSPALTYQSTYAATCTNEYTCNKATSVQDPAGIAYTYGYAFDGQINKATAPAVSGVSGETRWTYQNISGIRERRTQSQCQTANLNACVGTADEIKSTLNYGANANISSVDVKDGTGALTATTAMTYDLSGDVLTVDGPLAGTTDTTTYRYDAMRRLVGIIDPDIDGPGTMRRRAERYTYDSAGRVTLQEVGTVAGTTDPDWANFITAFQQSTQYNSNDQVIRQKLTGGGVDKSIVDYVYDNKGRLSCSVTYMDLAQWGPQATSCVPYQTNGPDGPDRVVKYAYDAANRVTELRLAVGTGDEAVERSLTYTDNGQGRTIKDGENNLSTFSYDEYDRFSKLEYPVQTKGGNASNPSDYEQLTYDNRSNVTSLRLRDGTSIAYTIDPLNRVSFKNLPGSEPDVTYTYDNLSKVRTASITGKTVTFGYDGLGRQTSDAQPYGTITRQFDLAGRVTRTTWWDGFFVDYNRLVTGEIATIRENGAASGVGVLATYYYDELRRRTSAVYGNSTTQGYTYDSVSRLATQSFVPKNSPTYDLTQTFTYNPASQIKQVDRSNNQYAFTGFVSGTTTSTSDGLNRISTIAGGTPTYDNRGNLTLDPTTSKTFSYSSGNQLKTATGGVTLNYDPLGRISEYNTPTANRYILDGLEVAADVNSSGAIQHRYIRGDGPDDLIVFYDGSGVGNRRFLQADERGSVLAVSDVTNTLAINKYDEFGNPQITANSGNFLYTGQMWLPEVGAYHYKARAYLPQWARFMQTDPIGYDGGPNVYVYVGNDPINLTDPLGLICPDGRNECPVIDPIGAVVTAPRVAPRASVDSSTSTGGGGRPGRMLPSDACQIVAAQSGTIKFTGTTVALVLGLGLSRTEGTFTNTRTGSTGHFVSYGVGAGLNMGVGRTSGYYDSISNFMGYAETAEAGVSLYGSALTFSAFVAQNAKNEVTAGGAALSVAAPLPLPGLLGKVSLSGTASDTKIFQCTVGQRQ